MAPELIALNSSEFLRLLASTKTASDLPPSVSSWLHEASWPPPVGEIDTMLRRHNGLRAQAACAACSTPAERERIYEQMDAELMPALRQLNPKLYP